MKETLISLTICLLSTFSLAQNMERESFDSNIQEVLKNRFNGGFDAFARFFYSQVKYPAEARAECRVGQLLVEVNLSSQGDIIEVQFLNELGKGIEDEVKVILERTKGQWTAASDEAVLRFSIAFNMGKYQINGDLNVIAYSATRLGNECEGDAYYEDKLQKALESGKTEKAAGYCEELLRRYPFSKEYRRIYKELTTSD